MSEEELGPKTSGPQVLCGLCHIFFKKGSSSCWLFWERYRFFSPTGMFKRLNIAWLLQTLSPTFADSLPGGEIQEAASTCWTSQSCSGTHISLISTWRSFWHVLYGCRLPRWFSSLVVYHVAYDHMDDGTLYHWEYSTFHKVSSYKMGVGFLTIIGPLLRSASFFPPIQERVIEAGREGTSFYIIKAQERHEQ